MSAAFSAKPAELRTMLELRTLPKALRIGATPGDFVLPPDLCVGSPAPVHLLAIATCACFCLVYWGVSCVYCICSASSTCGQLDNQHRNNLPSVTHKPMIFRAETNYIMGCGANFFSRANSVNGKGHIHLPPPPLPRPHFAQKRRKIVAQVLDKRHGHELLPSAAPFHVTRAAPSAEAAAAAAKALHVTEAQQEGGEEGADGGFHDSYDDDDLG